MELEEQAIETHNEVIVEERFLAWRAGTGSPYDLLAENVAWTISGRSLASKTYHGREAFLEGVIRPFNARMKEKLKPTIRKIFADGDWVIILFDASGIAIDGLPYENTYSWYLRLEDDLIVEAFAFFDSITFDDLWKRVPAVRSE